MAAAIFISAPHRALLYAAVLGALFFLLASLGGWVWLVHNVAEPLGAQGTQDRVEYIRVGLGVIQEHPLLGIGFRNIGRVLHTPIHNAFLQMSAEIGVPAGCGMACR